MHEWQMRKFFWYLRTRKLAVLAAGAAEIASQASYAEQDLAREEVVQRLSLHGGHLHGRHAAVRQGDERASVVLADAAESNTPFFQ
jgi:hypothetical protein